MYPHWTVKYFWILLFPHCNFRPRILHPWVASRKRNWRNASHPSRKSPLTKPKCFYERFSEYLRRPLTFKRSLTGSLRSQNTCAENEAGVRFSIRVTRHLRALEAGFAVERSTARWWTRSTPHYFAPDDEIVDCWLLIVGFVESRAEVRPAQANCGPFGSSVPFAGVPPFETRNPGDALQTIKQSLKWSSDNRIFC